MRIALFTEGTYPVVSGGVTTWCDHLVHGMPEHTFVPVTVIAGHEKALPDLPANVADVTLIPMWGRVRPAVPLVDLPDERHLSAMLAALWATVLPADGGRGDLAAFRSALQAFTGWRRHRLDALLKRVGSTRWILAAWREHRAARPDLPTMTLADASVAAAMVDRILALADKRWPEVDLSHVASNGPPSVLALGRWWNDGVPIVVTEHGIYLRERFLALAQSGMAWSSRYAIGTFLRLLNQLTYAEARAIAPVSEFNRTWELELGADRARTATIYNGVDTDDYRPLTSEPQGPPTAVFVGRIDPLKDLETMLDAFAHVHATLPEARLRLFGPVPAGNEAYAAALHEQVDRLGLGEVVSFEGPVPTAMRAFEAGHVVALSSISEGLPYSVIEAMMAGRPSVNTDVGGVAEIVGDDGRCGIVVPPRDPDALGAALTALLTDADRRSALGRAARARATELFSMDTFVARYRALYDAAAEIGQPPLHAGPDAAATPDPTAVAR